MSATCQHVACGHGHEHDHDGGRGEGQRDGRAARPAWQRVVLAPVSLITALLLALIWIYRLIVSPLFSALGTRCRFYPTCSVYAAESLRKHGLLVGSAKAVYRLLRCHPFCRGGHDPP